MDEEEEFMKKEYESHKYPEKIELLSEYYKFHKNTPQLLGNRIERIMSVYHEKRREYDYKVIKKKLKEEQNVSINSIEESESSIQDSQYEKKSRYSSMLHSLNREEARSESFYAQDLLRMLESGMRDSNGAESERINGSFEASYFFKEFLKEEEKKQQKKQRQRYVLRPRLPYQHNDFSKSKTHIKRP